MLNDTRGPTRREDGTVVARKRVHQETAKEGRCRSAGALMRRKGRKTPE